MEIETIRKLYEELEKNENSKKANQELILSLEKNRDEMELKKRLFSKEAIFKILLDKIDEINYFNNKYNKDLENEKIIKNKINDLVLKMGIDKIKELYKELDKIEISKKKNEETLLNLEKQKEQIELSESKNLMRKDLSFTYLLNNTIQISNIKSIYNKDLTNEKMFKDMINILSTK